VRWQGFGGIASGPQPLQRLHKSIETVLVGLVGKPITVTAIVDLMNLIGRCVVAGQQRQSAEIAFGDPDCKEYIDLKDYDVNPHRAEYGWTSNNSVFAKLGMDYTDICKRVMKNGEPGNRVIKYGFPMDHAE
jgi:ribonucleoside-triphosphate reductase (thioredoxin)